MKYKKNNFYYELLTTLVILIACASSATVASPNNPNHILTQGYADAREDGVTGAGTEPIQKVLVSSASAMQEAINNYSGTGGLLIIYKGNFDFESIKDSCRQWQLPKGQIVLIKNKSDITILGANGSSANFGIAIKDNSKNIVIRNMTIGLLPGSIDAIGILGKANQSPSHIWIDHNTLFSSLKECPGAGDLEFDGLIDHTGGAHHITYSYNYIHDHHKVGLMGGNESDEADRYVTFHHNYYENVGSRTPLQRGGFTHIYSNLYSQIGVSGINVRMGGYALIESNYFENAANPILSKDSANPGYWELKNNNITSPSEAESFGITWSECSKKTACLKNAEDWMTTAAYPKKIPYTYQADPPECVKEGLPAVAGAGTNLEPLLCGEVLKSKPKK